jgi:two-component system sensor histidine kinase VicK
MKELKNNTIRKAGVLPEYANAGTFSGCWKLVLGSNKLTICPRIRKMLELPKSQSLSITDVLKLIQPDQVMNLIREYKYACANSSNFEVRVKIITPKGKEKWVRIAGVLYYRRWGKAEQMIGVIEDTTQQVNEECFSLAVVNHELRSPLTIIKLNVQLLINMFAGGLDKYPVKVLNNVDLHINSMTSLIEEYLTTPITSPGASQNSHTVFEIGELVDIMINEMRTLHTGYRFYKLATEPVWVRANKYKIVQVLINYLTNAVNFSPRSSQIVISINKIDGQVEVAIRDQGIGIPEGQEQQIFQKFYRCDAKAIRQKNSKGLGLFLVKKIIQEHRGTVRAERVRDGGSVFYFSLPVHVQHIKETGARAMVGFTYG